MASHQGYNETNNVEQNVTQGPTVIETLVVSWTKFTTTYNYMNSELDMSVRIFLFHKSEWNSLIIREYNDKISVNLDNKGLFKKKTRKCFFKLDKLETQGL